MTAAPVAAAIAMLCLHAIGIVIRDDVSDAAAVKLGEPFVEVGRVVPDGGCTLIAPTWAITAAHVAASLPSGATIVFGDRRYEVTRVVLHPEGGAQPGVPPEVDLALLELATPVQDVPPVPLYRARDELGATLVIVGYGDFGTPKAGLQRTDGRRRAATNVVVDTGPRRVFVRFDAPPAGTAVEGVGGPGDSGCPALIDASGVWQVAGISSASMDGRPGQYGVTDVYTRVSSYLAWIDQTIAGR